MKLFILLFLGLFSVTAMALEPTSPEAFNFIAWVAGDKAALVFTILMSLGYLWAFIRQLIPAQKLSRMPKVVIEVLEFLAANKGHAKNRVDNDPQHQKLIRSS